MGPTQPLIQWAPGFYLGRKDAEACTDHSHPLSTDVKNEWNYTSIPRIGYTFMMWTDDFTLTFTPHAIRV